jgi:hypothetical protein
MKKLLLVAAMFCMGLGAFAQGEKGTFTIQPKFGMNVSNLVGSDAKYMDETFIEYDFKAKVGFTAGAEAEYMFTDMVSGAIGVMWSMQGTKLKDAADVKFKMDYVNVPIVCNVYVAKGLAVKAGLQFGFKTGDKITYKGEKIGSFKDNVNGLDVSIPVGLSYEYSNIVLDARYNWGLTKAIKESKIRNSVFQFTLGYKIAL